MRPRAIDVKVLDNYRLLLTFSNEEIRIFDVKPYLKFKQFEKLKDFNIFKTVKIAGLSVEWIGEIDICPDELYNNSVLVN